MKLVYPPGATPLDANEIDGLIPSSISTQGELNAFEQANIAEAEGWALAGKHSDPLSDTFIRDLHKRMFGQVWRWAGSYRKTDKNLGEPWQQVPMKVRAFCDDVAFWIKHRTYEWDELGARFHHRLVAIHPFPNGNGRHARLMTETLLQHHGVPLFGWGRNARTSPDEVRKGYLAALRTADSHDIGPLIAFVRS